MAIYTIYVMCENNDSAMHMATTLVNEGVVACANVSPGVQSFYSWDGLLQMENEYALLMKTSEAALEKAIARIKELHHYEVPCITAWKVEAGNPDYIDWVKMQTAGQ